MAVKEKFAIRVAKAAETGEGGEEGMSDTDFLRALLKQIGQPLERRCRHCDQMHKAQSYRIFNKGDGDAGKIEIDDEEAAPDPDLANMIMIDFGRCDAMKSPHDCFKTWLAASEVGRGKMRQLVRGLVGDAP